MLFPRDTCPVKTLIEFRAGATANGTSAQEVALSKKNRHHAGDQEPAKLFVDKDLHRHDVREGAARGTLFRHGRLGFHVPRSISACTGRTAACVTVNAAPSIRIFGQRDRINTDRQRVLPLNTKNARRLPYFSDFCQA